MRFYLATSVAMALSVAAAQPSSSISTTPSTSTVSASSGSSNSITTAGSVTCAFRYSMPTATNLPSGVSTTLVTRDNGTAIANKTAGSVEGNGSDAGLATVDAGSDSLSSSSEKDAIQNMSMIHNSSPSKSLTAITKTPVSPTTKTPVSPITKTPVSPITKTPVSTTITKTPVSTTITKTPVSTTTTKTPVSTPSLDSSMSNTTVAIPTLGSHDGRRLIDEVATITATNVTAVRDTSGSTGPTAPATSSTTKTPSLTTETQSSTTNPPSSSANKTPSSPLSPMKTLNATAATLMPISPIETPINEPSMTTAKAIDTVGLPKPSVSSTIAFSCDSTFYGAWTRMGLTCEGTELDIVAAVASTECLIYSGTSSGTDILDLATCLSICRFPACHNGTWDYSSIEGINSAIYAELDFIRLLSLAGPQAAEAAAVSVQQPFSNLTFAAKTECDYTSDDSFHDCECANVASSTPSSGAASTSTNSNAQYTVPSNKGLEDSHHWADGTKKSSVDKVGIASTSIGSGAATVSIVAGGVMSVASGVVGGTSAGVASGASAAASVGITMAAVDICQFSIMLTQMNVDARPRFMENMGKKMAPAAFTFLPFGKSSSTSSDDLNSISSGSAISAGTPRRLVTGSSANGSSSHGSGADTSVQGMEKYAALIGVDPDMLFYLAVAGIACMVGIIFGLYAMAMGVCYFIVEDFPTFSRKWLDKTIGVLMMILILSEYVVGATAMYQICYCIDHDSVDVSFVLAIATLLGLAFGTILYGVLVIKNNEDELRDLGTKDHFDKKFHNRYGPLYDEHSFEGRFFFAPKLLLALLCGMTTGMVWVEGLWQIVVLIVLHIAFLLYLEIKQPYPTAFVQKTSSFVIIIKISALFLSFFLLSSATSFTESIPDDLREGVAFAIVGLQVLVLVCLMIRQIFIFYRTWKLKRDGASTDDKTVTVQTTNAREGSEAFFALGSEPQYHSNNTNQSRGNSLPVLGDDSTPKMQDHLGQETPSSNVKSAFGNQPYGFQSQQGSSYGMQRNHFGVQHNNLHRNNEVDL